jgi:hypothetical protein
LANSDRLQATLFGQSGYATNLVTTRAWERGERLQRLTHTVTTNSTSFTLGFRQYAYDPLQRRTQALLEDGSRWQYGYNDRDEVTLGRRFLGDGAAVSGQQFTYGFDTIGNRTGSAAGGDANGAGLRAAGYGANELNQYTNLVTAGYKDVLGLAFTTNNVWVNGTTNGVERHIEYFRKELAIDNSGGPVWTSVTVTNQNGTNAGGFALAKNQQAPGADLSGNLSLDSIWSYAWDGANRLAAMTMTNVASVPSAQRKQLLFTYDDQGRRVLKVVKTWNSNSNAFLNPATNFFVYDGWRPIAVLTNGMKLVQSYAWGLDLILVRVQVKTNNPWPRG